MESSLDIIKPILTKKDAEERFQEYIDFFSKKQKSPIDKINELAKMPEHKDKGVLCLMKEVLK